MLVTSREPLGLIGEITWRAPSLTVPAAGSPLAPDALASVPAVALFVERARAVRPDFQVTPANAAAVAEICTRLDGIPLAIELAAARLGALTAEQIAARLGDRFRLLTAGSRTAPPRQQTLRATLDWSHALLTTAEQTLLRQLAVFAGGWTLEAAEVVCGTALPGDGFGSPDMLDLLARLVDRSLVHADVQGKAARYRLLETVRQYAWEKLRAAEEEQEQRARHLAWCVALADAAVPHLAAAEQVPWLARLETEHDNLRAALAWSTQVDPATGLALAADLAGFWQRRSHLLEGRRWLEHLLERTAETTAGRTAALLGASVLARLVGDHAAAGRHLMEAVVRTRAAGNSVPLDRALAELGMARAELGDFVAAQPVLDEALALARAGADPFTTAVALLGRGWLAHRTGDAATALPLLEEGLGLARASGDRWLVGDLLNRLGRAVGSAGDQARARALFEEGLALARVLGSTAGAAWQLLDLGLLATWQGDLDRATARLDESLGLARELGDRERIAWTRLFQGEVALARDEPARATPLLQESLHIFRALGGHWGEASALRCLAKAATAAGEAERATALVRESLPWWQKLGDQRAMALCLEDLAAAGGEARPLWAARLLGAAAALRRTAGLVPVSGRVADAVTPALRATLGEAAFATAWAAGAAMAPERAVAAALAEPVAGPPPSGRRSAGLLTPREEDVANLLARGLTNRQIATALSISERTVDHHVGSILNRLGLESRTQIAAWMGERRGRLAGPV
jgi:predicted ATPase/DNA-binding CsgD family transcriptional regulator